jgi:hypothetical protein
MNTNIQNINTNNNNQSEEITLNTTDSLIQALTAHFNENPQGFTSYRKEIESLLKDNIKPLASRSSKVGDDWRSNLKSKFSGRGAKWVFVSNEVIEETLVQFESNGIDCSDYRKNTQKLGKAWIRFNGARVNNGVKCAAFEVRTEGSTIDHPKQLHMISVDSLDNTIETMPGTPKSLKLEEDSAPMPKVSKPKKEKVKAEPVVNELEALSEEINMELQEPELNESPESNDPAEWEAFLAAEGLIDDDFDMYDDEF